MYICPQYLINSLLKLSNFNCAKFGVMLQNTHPHGSMIRKLILFFALLTFSLSSFSQSIANYSVSRTTGITYNSILPIGTPAAAWRNNGAYIPDDNRCYQEDIGFDFWHNGVRYTKFSISTNGFIDFSSNAANGTGTGVYGYDNTRFSNATGTLIAIAPMYDDQTTQGAVDPLGTSIVYLLEGTAPNRVLTVEWLNMAVYGNTTPDLNYQVKLHETTGVIEIVYGTMTNGTPTFSYSCGINGTVNTQLLTQQTANTTTFSSTAKNNLSIIPTSNSKLTFTPPTPTAVSGSLTFTGITSTGITLNWSNWALNEVGYVVYYSTDGINYSYLAQTAANATSYSATGLLPATTYYWKLMAVTEGKLSDALTGTQATASAGNKVSASTGNWNTAGTWTPAGVPTAGDNVTIANGHTVTVNTNAICNTLTVGQGVSGILSIGDNTIRSMTVNGDFTVATGGSVVVSGTKTHTLTLDGNLTVTGSFNMVAANVCNVTFNKNGNQTVSGSGTTIFNLINVNLGTSNTNVLDITSSNFTAASNFLTLTNGTFKLSSGNTATHTPFTAAKTIPATCALWINSATSTVNTGSSLTATGDLTLSAGTLNIGNAADENLISGGGQITVSGGTMNIAGRFDRTFSTTITKLSISGGSIIVPTVNSTSTAMAPIQMDVMGSIFDMSGGTIIIERAGNSGGNNLGLIASNGTLNVTGGTLQIGDASSPVTQTISINSSVSFANVDINSANVTALLTNNLTVLNDFSITSGTFNCNTFSLSVGRHWTNTGTFTTGTGTINFNGTGTQTITKSGGETFYNFTINKTSGTISLANDINISNTLTLTSGNIDCGSYTVTLGTSAVAAGTLTYTSGNIIGKFNRWINTPTVDVFFPIGTSTNSRMAQLNFTNLVAGTLMSEFIATDPGNNGLPVSESGMSMANQYTDGYWNLTAANSLTSTNYLLYLTGTGFSSYSITSSTRLLYRATSGNVWSLNGIHVAAASNIVKRTGINGLSAQFAFGKSSCDLPVTSSITGSTSVCTNTTGSAYSVTNTSGNTYAWIVNLGTIITGQGTNSITVDWGASAGLGSVQVTETNVCSDAGTPVITTVYINPIATSVITGNITVAANETGIAYSVTNTPGYSYTWVITGGTQASGTTTNAITVDWGVARAGNVQVTATRLCGGTDVQSLGVTIRGPIVSNASGNWTTGATWVGGVAPTNVDYVQIASGHTVTMNGNAGACYKLTIDGTATWTSEFFTNVGNGGVVINGTGNITGLVNGTLTSTGGLTLNSSLTSDNVNVVLQTTANQTISGTGSLAKLAINASTTNTGTLTVRSALTGSSTLINDANATININCSSVPISGITATANGNTINYGASNVQTVLPLTYYNLGLLGTNTKTLGGNITVGNELSLSSITLDASLSNYEINLAGNLLNTSGTFIPRYGRVTFNGTSTIQGSSVSFNNLTVSGTLVGLSAGNINIAGNFDNTGTFNHNNGTVTFNGTTALAGSSGFNFNNLTISNSLTSTSSSIGIAGNFTNNGTFIHNSGTIEFNDTSTLSGSSTSSFNNILITGILNGVSSGNFNIAGNFTNNGTYNYNSGTVTFNGTSTISGTTALTTFNNLTINSTCSLNVAPGKQLTVGGSFTNNGTFTLKSDASANSSFIDNGIAGTGTNISELYLLGNQYYYLSSPISNSFSDVFPGTNTVDNGIYSFNEPTTAYVRIIDNTTALNPAQGYICKFKNVASKTLQFQGALNTGAKSLSLTGTTHFWNLAGNPYPSAIDWEAASGWTKTNVRSDIYYRSNGSYATYNATSHIGTNGGQQYIPAMQAFWVKCTAATGTLAMTNALRTHNTHSFYRERNAVDLLKINVVSSNGQNDEMAISFINGATDNYDIYDSEKMFSSDIAYPQLYTVLETTKKMAIDVKSELINDVVIPLGFKTNVAGKFIVTISGIESFSSEDNLYFEDADYRELFNLRENPSYTFVSDVADNNTRFFIHIKKPFSLPVNLLTFHALLKDDIVNLDWVTASEKNNELYTVERSCNGSEFISILEIPGAGNSSEIKKYQTIDNKPLKGTSYYRLKQSDFDGNATYSSIVQVNNNNNNSEIIDNLVVSKEKVSFSINNNSLILNLKIVDNKGNTVINKMINSESNPISIDISELSSATYILQLNSSDKNFIEKFFKP